MNLGATRREDRALRDIQMAAAVVLLDEHVLIVRRSKKEKFLPRQWGVPCGKYVRENEGAEQAVLRELAEETGLTGKVVCPAGQMEFKSEFRGELVLNVQRNFLVKLASRPSGRRVHFRRHKARFPKIKTPERDQKARWVPISQYESVGLDDHNRATIRKGLAAAQEPQARRELVRQFTD
jgi:8-oxo-dGTP diphosphatase